MTSPLIRQAQCPATDPRALDRLLAGLAGGPLACVIVFADPATDPGTIAALAQRLAPTPVVGCTTAGEITDRGYTDGTILTLGLPVDDFATQIVSIDTLSRLDPQDLIQRGMRAKQSLAQTAPDWAHEFALLLIDGLSLREDDVAAALAPALGTTPLFGGSAGDGERFGQTRVIHGAQAVSDSAVLVLVRTRCPLRVFKFDHFTPSDTRMVVTGADPSRRVVTSINAEPAAQEYARILGKDPAQLTPFTFAAHPVVVRLGEQHYVRSIQRVDDNGDLIFFSAIDEGLVLSLAQAQDMVAHLDSALSGLTGPQGAPAAILGCDCLLRRIEAQEKQVIGKISETLKRHRVTGFSTYGEQMNAMHVNQTLTGVALYSPENPS